MDKQLLHRTNSLKDQSRSVDIKQGPMEKYNFVIQCYNTDENRVGSFYLESMPESCLYNTFYKIFSYPCFLLIFDLLILVPGLGIILFLWLLYSTVHYFRGLSVFNNNRRLVSDPFQNMIFCSEICRPEAVTNKYLSVKPQGKIFLCFYL